MQNAAAFAHSLLHVTRPHQGLRGTICSSCRLCALCTAKSESSDQPIRTIDANRNGSCNKNSQTAKAPLRRATSCGTSEGDVGLTEPSVEDQPATKKINHVRRHGLPMAFSYSTPPACGRPAGRTVIRSKRSRNAATTVLVNVRRCGRQCSGLVWCGATLHASRQSGAAPSGGLAPPASDLHVAAVGPDSTASHMSHSRACSPHKP